MTPAIHNLNNSAPDFDVQRFVQFMKTPRNADKALVLWPILWWKFEELPKPPLEIMQAIPPANDKLTQFVPVLKALGFTHAAAHRILRVCDVNKHRTGQSVRLTNGTKYDRAGAFLRRVAR